MVGGSISGTPVHRGKTVVVLRESPSEAGVSEKSTGTDSDSILASLFVESVVGALDVVVYTEISPGRELPVITFPTITAATANLVIKKAAAIMSNLRVVATYSGACSFEVAVRGIGSGDLSVTILGASNGKASQATVTPTAAILLPASLNDRVGIVLRNYNEAGTIYIGYSAAEADAAVGYPLDPREAMGIDIAAGAELWAVSTVPTVDVRIMEADR